MPTPAALRDRYASMSRDELEALIASRDLTEDAEAIARSLLAERGEAPDEGAPAEDDASDDVEKEGAPVGLFRRVAGVSLLVLAGLLAWQHWEWAQHGRAEWPPHALFGGLAIALAALGLYSLDKSAPWAVGTTLGLAASAAGLAAVRGVEGSTWIAVGAALALAAAGLLRLMWPRR